MSAERDIAMAREALRLEREAVARYTDHPADSSDPGLVAYWESLRRNEAGHRELLEAWLRGRGADPDEDVEAKDAGRAAAAADAAASAGQPGRRPLSPPQATVRGRRSDSAVLRADYDFEDEAVAVYGRFAYQAEDRELMELFKELARAESGHRNGLRRTIRSVEGPERPVVVFCSLCGWEIDFGPTPEIGAQRKCPMCPGRFALRLDEDGDWTLERLVPR